MEWIHCNKCYLRFQPGMKFFITSCGHLKCQTCFSKIADDKRCLVCNSSCNVASLSNMDPSLQPFFQSPNDLFEKMRLVAAFQHGNMISLLKHISTKYSTLKSELLKIHKSHHDLKKDHAKGQKENARLRTLLKGLAARGNMGGFFGSTASSNVSMTPSMNTSDISAPDMSFMPRRVHPMMMQRPGGSRLHATSTPMVTDRHSVPLSPIPGSVTSNMTPINDTSLNSASRCMPRNIPSRRMMPQQQHPNSINSYTSQSGSSHGRQDPAPAQASIPRYGTPSFPHAAMMSMSNLGLGNKPR